MPEEQNLIEYRVKKLEDALSSFMSKMESIPTTLEAIQKDLSENQQLKKDVAMLKAWRTGIVMVIGAVMFVSGYIVNMMVDNLKLHMKETAVMIVRDELSRFTIEK